MCRLFGLASAKAAPARPWLLDAEHSLLKQSDAKVEQLQSDGWGIASFGKAGRLRVDKGVGGAYEAGEKAQFRKAAIAARGTVVIGHLRRASNPMRLPSDRLPGLENTQPFAFGSTVFAHNGQIPFPLETRSLLGPLDSNVKGVNDSEVLFWLLVRHLERNPNPVYAYAHAVEDLVKVWRRRESATERPYTGLNVLLSRGPQELWAFCHSKGDHGSSLMDPYWPYYEMAWVEGRDHVVVGSEPLGPRSADWYPLKNGQYLNVRVEDGRVAAETGKIPLEAARRISG